MGFFDGIIGQDKEAMKFNKEEAFMGVLLSVIASDGYFSQEEVSDFWTTLGRSKTMSKYSEREYNDSMNKLMKVIKGPGYEALLHSSIAALPVELHQGAFIYACDLVFADGSASEEEQAVLNTIKAELKIDDALAYKVIEVIITKNKV